MANKTIEQLKAEAAVVRDATEEKENTAMRVGTVLIDMIDTLSESVSINAIKGYVVIDSTSELPENPTPEQQQKGYLLNTTLYVYVGTGGDTLDGKYQSAQLKGADGAPGAPGEKGDKGDSGVDLGEVVLVNDLTTGGEGSALSAEQGKVLNERFLDSEEYTRYAYPEIFGNYALNNTGNALVANNGYWCTVPMLVKAGETIKTPSSLTWQMFATILPENLPLTPSSSVVRVDSSGGTSRVLSYTNNTGSDIYVICLYGRGVFSGGYPINAGTTIQHTFTEILDNVNDVQKIFMPPQKESIIISNFATGQMNISLTGEHVGTYYKVNNANYVGISNPIQLLAGDTLHVKLNTAANEFHFLKLEDSETQTTSTYYPGLKTKLKATDVSLKVDEDTQVVLCYSIGTIVDAYIEHSVVSSLQEQVGYSTIANECIVENADSDVCLIMGSSLTHSDYSPKSMSWIERVNDLVDIGIVNGGHSGANLSGNITDMTTGTINLLGVSLKSLRPRYIVSNNDANSTPTGKDLDTQLKQFERIAQSVGATCLVCGEEPTLINAANYHKQAAMTKRGLNYYPSAMLWYNLNRTQLYTGWMDGSQHVHSNAKNGSSHVSMAEMLSQLYIHKSVKFYKVRENYKDGSPTTAQLAYTSNTERAAIWRGTCPAIGNGTSPWANDNIDGTGYIDGETPGVDKMTDTNITSEVATAKGGGAVTFYKHALVEIITPRVQVSKAQVAIECSAEPTTVGYISNGAYVALTPTYADCVITIDLNSADIQDYDKIRIVVSDTDDETFTLGKVKAVLFDGESKPSYEVRYKGRKVGTELMSKTSVESGWTMSGNAFVKQLPTAVRNYTSLNNVSNHIQLDDDSASATYTQSLGKTVHKVAVRIAATIFPPIQTKRTSNDYTTTEQNLFRGMYYGGDLLLTISNAYIPLHIEFGWTEVYAEAIIDSNSLSMSLGRATAFDPDNYNVGEFPVLIHNVSVQEID